MSLITVGGPNRNITCWRVPSSGMSGRVALVRTDVSEERGASIIRVTRIGGLGTTLAVTSNRRFLSPWWWRRYVPPKRRFLQEPHGVTSQKMAFFIVTAVKTSNLTLHVEVFHCSVPYNHTAVSRELPIVLKDAVVLVMTTPCGSCNDRRFRGSSPPSSGMQRGYWSLL
jgi:hypothetical protein